MAVYQVISEGDPVLREKAKEVKKINAATLRVLDNMKDTMYANDGVGLAAPQIGISKRIMVVDIGDNYLELINPEIYYKKGEVVANEACLSVPGFVGKVKRAEKIAIRALDREGQSIDMEAENLLARALQHELDHLNGILFIDIATNVKSEN